MSALIEAQKAFRERNFRKAEELLAVALQDNPQDAVPLLRLGQVYMAQGMFSKSLDHLRRAQKLDPQNHAVYRSMGLAIRMSGQIDLGISYLGVILSNSPMMLQPQVHLTLAELFAAKGDCEALKNSLLLLEKIPSENPRMELRLWCELEDSDAMLRVAKNHPKIQELAKGLAYEQSNAIEAQRYLLSSSCLEYWEANLALFRLTNSKEFLDQAFQQAPQTAEVLLYRSQYMPFEERKNLLERLGSSPVIFASIRRDASRLLKEIS